MKCKFIYCHSKNLSSVKRFTSANFRTTAFTSSNRKLKFWRSSELPQKIFNVVNCCYDCCRNHQGHWLWSVTPVVAISRIRGNVNGGAFQKALVKFGIIGENEIHVVQTKRHKTQPASGHPTRSCAAPTGSEYS